jgi:membrane protein
MYKIIKTFILAFRNIKGYQLITRSSALTYNSLLSIIPLLAVLFAIAKGFGFQNIVQSEIFHYFGGQKDIMTEALEFIDKSLEYAKTGVFLGIGIILLFYTVINLISAIEKNFNDIWRVKKGRSLYRMFTDYFALFLITPLFLIVNAGLSLFLNSVSNNSEVIDFVVSPILKIAPYLIVIFLFTFLFIYIPNTKIKFTAALFGGVFSGVFFQLFQYFYISGQINISKYNAIYGSFAALPLLLMWLQISWFICLFGVALAFSYQNVHKFSFENESKNISRRYKDFVLLLISTLIIKRFEKGETPYTADELSEQYKIPTQLTNDAL